MNNDAHIFTCKPNEIGEYVKKLSPEDFKRFAFGFLAMPMDDTIVDNGEGYGGFFSFLAHAPKDQMEAFAKRCTDSDDVNLQTFMQSKIVDFANFCQRRRLLVAFVKSMETPQLKAFSLRLDADELTILKSLTQRV